MLNQIQIIRELLLSYQFSLHNEKILQAEMFEVLKNEVSLEREFQLDNRSIIDFLTEEGIGIEVKIKGSPLAIYRQLERYASFDKIKSLILVTNKSMGLPEKIGGKKAYIVNLGEGWL